MSSTPIYDELAATYLAEAEPGEPAPPPADPTPDAAPPGRPERASRDRPRKKPKV